MGGSSKNVWITGVGLLSSIGEGNDTHLQALKDGEKGNVDTQRFAPYPVHALGEVDWATQISRRDMRQMEPWQQIGTYAAGLALDDAKAKEDEELCGRMDMIVCAGGGERDIEVDSALFLAQLSNLLAGNISIVHKVTGSSRTFMGEEGAGISAIQTAHARIAAGQSDIVLVGGAFNGEREDMILLYELGHNVLKGDPKSVWNRLDGEDGFSTGSIGAFLVLESEAHAKSRGVEPYAKLHGVVADHGARQKGAAKQRLEASLDCLPTNDATAVFSGACGVANITAEEREFLDDNFGNAPVRAYGSLTGHGVEAHFPLGVALAALCIKDGSMPAPFDEHELNASAEIDNLLVTTLGHWRSEGLGLVTTAKA